MAKINDDSLEKMWEAFNMLVSEQNDEQNGMTKSERKKLDTITSKLTLLLESLENKRLWFNNVDPMSRTINKKVLKFE